MKPNAKFASRRKSDYATEMADARTRVAAVPSETLVTRFGTVEYVDAGEGPSILWSHGVLGGHDNVRELVDLYIGTDFRAIGPSRFGSDRVAILLNEYRFESDGSGAITSRRCSSARSGSGTKARAVPRAIVSNRDLPWLTSTATAV
jgi:hypothetical protein